MEPGRKISLIGRGEIWLWHRHAADGTTAPLSPLHRSTGGGRGGWGSVRSSPPSDRRGHPDELRARKKGQRGPGQPDSAIQVGGVRGQRPRQSRAARRAGAAGLQNFAHRAARGVCPGERVSLCRLVFPAVAGAELALSSVRPLVRPPSFVPRSSLQDKRVKTGTYEGDPRFIYSTAFLTKSDRVQNNQSLFTLFYAVLPCSLECINTA